MSTATTTTLAEQTRKAFGGDDDTAREAIIRAAETYPPEQDGTPVKLSRFESDLRDWGLIFGLAVAVARAEDPFESWASVTARATEAAKTVFASWTGEFTPFPNRDVLARNVAAAYGAWEDEFWPKMSAQRDQYPGAFRLCADLQEAAYELAEEAGVPLRHDEPVSVVAAGALDGHAGSEA